MFPLKLHYLLSQETSAIRWTLDGTAIRIIDKDMLLKDYLPLYFNQKSFASFRHQLSTYGFIKIKKGPNVDCYYHPYFQRDFPCLVLNIHRVAPKCRRVRLDGKLMRVPLDEVVNVGILSSASSQDQQHIPKVTYEGVPCDSFIENSESSTNSLISLFQEYRSYVVRKGKGVVSHLHAFYCSLELTVIHIFSQRKVNYSVSPFL